MTSGVTDVRIRPANLDDLDAVKQIADHHKDELGFVPRPALVRSVDRQQLFVAENNAELVGFVDFRHRRDGQTTLYHLAVRSEHRGQGIGRALISALADDSQRQGKSYIQLKCPEALPANTFYESLGFQPIGVEKGNRRPLVVWRLNV